MLCKVTLLFLFRFLELQVLNLAIVLGNCSFQSGKGVGIRAEFNSNKTNVSVERSDLSWIKVGRTSWDRAHEDSAMAALVPGRGVSTTPLRPVEDSSGDVFRDFYILLEESLICAGIHTNKG
eukprot:1158662-Pelagomonas_calceolata.AAC.10